MAPVAIFSAKCLRSVPKLIASTVCGCLISSVDDRIERCVGNALYTTVEYEAAPPV